MSRDISVGIENMNLYAGRACLSVRTLFEERGLNLNHFDNLMMKEKSVHLPWEDPITNAVNAAKPIIDALSDEERDKIEMVITSSESGIDFGKSISTYVHDHLGLNRRCRLFEVKQACYGGTAAVQMALNYVASGSSPGCKVLVVSSDICRSIERMGYAEPSNGAGSVAMLISCEPHVFEVDFGKSGIYGYEVMDTCRPLPTLETGDADLSLLAYIGCVVESVEDYMQRYNEPEFLDIFDYMAFHTPFPGMVKGAFRHLLRSQKKMKAKEADEIFEERVAPSVIIPSRIGNLYSGSVYSALCSLIYHIDIPENKRVAIFSYGSGCSSEFYTGHITPDGSKTLQKQHIEDHLDDRKNLSMAEYETIFDENMRWFFGIEDQKMEFEKFQDIYDEQYAGKGILALDNIKGYHREYRWT